MRASLYDVTGKYIGETPVWFPEVNPDSRYAQISVVARDPALLARTSLRADGPPVTSWHVMTATFRVGRHANGALKLMYADRATQDAMEDLRKREEGRF